MLWRGTHEVGYQRWLVIISVFGNSLTEQPESVQSKKRSACSPLLSPTLLTPRLPPTLRSVPLLRKAPPAQKELVWPVREIDGGVSHLQHQSFAPSVRDVEPLRPDWLAIHSQRVVLCRVDDEDRGSPAQLAKASKE